MPEMYWPIQGSVMASFELMPWLKETSGIGTSSFGASKVVAFDCAHAAGDESARPIRQAKKRPARARSRRASPEGRREELVIGHGAFVAFAVDEEGRERTHAQGAPLLDRAVDERFR